MTIQQLNKELGNIDIYLLDQILKNRYSKDAKILDAGCGEGRNIIYFLNNNYNVYGIDNNEDAIRMLHFLVGSGYPSVSKNNFQVCSIERMPFEVNSFDVVICSAVLHFARDHSHFESMFKALINVLKIYGQIFIRMTSDIGIDTSSFEQNGDLYHLGDGSTRYLITRELISELMKKYSLELIEPIKSTNVNDLRSMATIVLHKTESSVIS